MKNLTVDIYGIEKWIDALDAEGEPIDGCSRFSMDEGLTFEINGNKYEPEDFGAPDCGNDDFDGIGEVNAVELFQECGAAKGILYVNKASCSFDIELPDGEEFDPKKVTLVCRDFIYPDGDESTLAAFVYDGKAYTDCVPMDSVGKATYTIWLAPKESSVEYTGETATEEQLADAAELPVLVFRYQTLSYCFSPGDEDDFEAEDYPELDGPGVISAINDEGDGITFVCDKCNNPDLRSMSVIEYINSGEMTEVLSDDGLTDYEITLAATESHFILLNYPEKPTEKAMLETIAAVWEPASENGNYKPAFDKLIFRAIMRDSEDYAQNGDYLLDNGKVYELPEGKFDEIIVALPAEDQELNKEITPFDEYEED